MDDSKRRGIQSVEIGMGVLSALAGFREPASLSRIAQAAGLSASQTHRYLASLVAAGMVKQSAAAGLYDLDSGAIRIGLAALARLDVFAQADAAVRAYVAASARTCLVAVWGDAGPTVVRWFAGNPPVVTSLAIGSVMPLLTSATGRVFLAFRDPAPSTTKEARALRLAARGDLCARIDGDLIPGLRVVSAPVFDMQGSLVLAITSIAGAAQPRAGDASAEARLLETCQALTESLGGNWPAQPASRVTKR